MGNMNKQISLSSLSDELSQARTRKKEFLEQMDRIIPWTEWIGIIKPHYYKGERGNKPYELETMLRIHMLQNLYDLSDMGVMTEVIDSRAFSEFCEVESSNQVPDGDTIGRFRKLLVEQGLQAKLFDHVVALLMERGLILKKGTIVDSSIIAAPPSTKNRERQRDPEAHQTKKGNTWHFGYKVHVGVDRDSGLVHRIETTAANVHDATMTPKLLHGEESTVHGDSGYLGADKRKDAVTHNAKGKKIRYKINRRPSQSKNNTVRSKAQIKRREREKSSIRSKVEHVFGVVKGLFGYRKTRYKGRRKQASKLHMMFALANLYLADKRCLAA
jgi:IS5 family transposase